MSPGLSNKLLEFAEALSLAEKDNLKLLLGEAASGLLVERASASTPSEDEALTASLSVLRGLQRHADRIPRNGITWRGRPGFLGSDLLSALCAEALKGRPSAIQEGGYMLGCGGPVADRLASSDDVVSFIGQHAGEVRPTSIASYLYYEQPGDGLDPHVDTDVFALNMIMMLRHDAKGGRHSRLVVHDLDGKPNKIELVPGECVLLFADSVVHGREAMAEGETVTLLTIGFEPV